MTEQVIYELGLRDKLSAAVDSASGHVKKLEDNLLSVKGILKALGVNDVYEGLKEFFRSSAESWDKMEFAMSQVEAGLKSTQGAAGLTFEELKQGAEQASHNLKYTQADLLEMQSILLTFPAVTKDTFGEASSIIADMSTRLGTDLKSSAIQLGKALQDPIKGITALRRVGVNFNEQQTETIKHLAETNQLAKAQALILKELQLEFGGSAQAAADADKSFRLDKTMEENSLALGEFLDQIKEEMMPMLIEVAKAFKDLIVWVREHWKEIKKLTVALGAAWLAFKVLTGAPAIFLAIENALVQAATAGASFGSVMTAALGPVGLLSAAIGGLVYLYQSVGDAAEEAENKRKNDFEKAGIEEREQLESVVSIYEKTMDKKVAIAKAKNDELLDIQGKWDAAMNEYDSKSKGDEDAFARSKEGIALTERMNILNEKKRVIGEYTGLVPKGKPDKGLGIGKVDIKPETKTKAVGSKAVTINVTIQKLLGVENINTTNLKESAANIGKAITSTMMNAVNDFQIVAGE